MVGTMKITKHGKKVFKENGVYESYVWCIKELDELSKKEKLSITDSAKLHNIYCCALSVSDVIKYKIINDKYNEKYDSRFYKIIYKFLGKDFNERLSKHRAYLRYYNDLADELRKINKNYYQRSIDDIKDAINLGFLTFVDFNNQMMKDDYNLFNRGNFTDSDIKDYKTIKDDVNELYGVLKYKNMLYEHNIKTK